MLVIGAPALIVPKRFMKVIGGFAKDANMVRMASLRTMFLAFFFLAMYPLLKGGRLLLVSILGRLMLIKSVIGVWFPSLFTKQVAYFYTSKMMTMIMGIISILFAAFIAWAGLVKF
jgi:hypothetical protein